MAELKWSKDLEVGNAVIDHDHEETIDLFNELIVADEAAFAPMFKLFVDHLATHFGHEEEMMIKCNFPAYDPHKSEHERVLGIFTDLAAMLDQGKTEDVRTAVSETVPTWFLEHRATMDQVTSNFIAMAG